MDYFPSLLSIIATLFLLMVCGYICRKTKIIDNSSSKGLSRLIISVGQPMMIIAAHKMLEKHTLTKWQQYWKDQIGTWYGMFLHEAQYLEPVMRDMEAFLDSTQQNVTGTVELTLRPYCYTLVGVESSFDLM